MRVVFDRPVNGVARQPVPARQVGKAVVSQAAQAAFGRRPERPRAIDEKTVDSPGAQAVHGSVRSANRAVYEIRHLTLVKSNPYAVLRWIRRERISEVLTAQRTP